MKKTKTNLPRAHDDATKRTRVLHHLLELTYEAFSVYLSLYLFYLSTSNKSFTRIFRLRNERIKFLIFNFSFPGLPLFQKPKFVKKKPSSTKPSNDAQRQPQNLLSSPTTLSKTDTNLTLSQNHAPSRWYTVLALPFPDQKLARRDISTFGRHGFYQSRAGFFSEPSPPLWNMVKQSPTENAIMCHSFDFQISDNCNHV